MTTSFKGSSMGLLRVAVVAAGAALVAAPAVAGSLENLERERALLLEAMLSADLTPGQRQSRFDTSKRRLVDLERIVLRDDQLVGRNTPTVQRAFGNYDLTFLVHAAMEKDLSIVDNWLEQVGVTTHSLMSATMGRRWDEGPAVLARH